MTGASSQTKIRSYDKKGNWIMTADGFQKQNYVSERRQRMLQQERCNLKNIPIICL